MIAIMAQIYREYKNKILNKYFDVITIKPMMKYREIDIIEDILKKYQPMKCLEWGAGYSTLYFPQFLNRDATWSSVEHDKIWAAKVQKLNKNPSVRISYVQPNSYPWTDKNNDGAFSDLKDYIEFPVQWGKFDFILIDGRARAECLIKADSLLNNEGVIVLHDANRQYYHEAFKNYKNSIYFENYRPNSHGLFVAGKGIEDIRDTLDVDKHLKLWKIYNKIGSFFHKKKLAATSHRN